MKKRHYIVPFVALSLSLAACQADEPDTNTAIPVEEAPIEEETEPETGTGDATSEVSEDEQIPTEGEAVDPDHALLDQAKEEYYSGELDAAAGTLSRLLQKDLSDNELLKAEAEDLQEEISQQQAENAAETAESQPETAYPEERQSAILSEEFEAANNKPLAEATDEELEAWLAEKDAQAAEPTIDEEEIDESETTEQIAMTKEEAENYAFEQVLERAEIEGENYFYFVNYSEENWVQVEARESVEHDGVVFSNLIGIYRYNVETDDMQKLDSITGEYNTVTE